MNGLRWTGRRGGEASGFTLIEVIAALALVAVLTAIFGMGLVASMRAFSFSRENVRAAQKGQIVMARISRELMELVNIRAVSALGANPAIVYERIDGNAQAAAGFALEYRPASQTLWLYTNLGGSALEANHDHLLADGVTQFALSYFKGAQSWSWGEDLNLLSAIRIDLALARRDDPAHSQNFSTVVHLRNTPNFGGAPPDSHPPSAATYNCFIMTLSADTPASSLLKPYSFIVLIPSLLLFLCFACRVRRKKEKKMSPPFLSRARNQRGNALLLTVAAIMTFAVLAAAIIPMVNTSSQQMAVSDAATKAFYLAESGFRYAASRFLNAGDSDAAKHNAIERLDGNYTLADNEGQFELRLYSYFLELTQSLNNTAQFKAHCPGSLPDDFIIRAGQKLRIGEGTYTVSDVDPVSGQADDNVTLTVTSNLPYFPRHTAVRPLADAQGTQAISSGGNLVYQSGDADMFPVRNGQVQIQQGATGRVLNYRFNDRANNRLTGLSDPDNPAFNITVNDGSPILLMPFVLAQVTGRYGDGLARGQRLVVYSAPLPISSALTQRVRFEETFENSAQWRTRIGSAEVQAQDGNNALTVTEAVGTTEKQSLTEFTPDNNSPVDFREAARGTGGYVSYDTQVKIGFYYNPAITAFDPFPPFPAYFSAGLAFRLRWISGVDYNLYGLGFLRGDSTVADGLADGIVPPAAEGRRAIVLWRQAGNGQNRTWLAYKLLSDDYLNTSFENTDTQWFNTSWSRHLDPNLAHTGNYSYRFQDPGGGSTALGRLWITTTLPDSDNIFLSFFSRVMSGSGVVEPNELIRIRVRPAGASTWVIDEDLSNLPLNQWNDVTGINLTQFRNQATEIRFYYYSPFFTNVNPCDWYIDDVRIEADWPIQESTLALRLQEAAALPFINGGPDAILKGDWVVGATSGAQGRVAFTPIVSSGTWSGGNAAGLLQVQRVTGVFEAEELNVVGSGRRATLTAYNDSVDRKVNFIKAYYGRSTGADAGDSNRFNDVMRLNPRLIDPANQNLNWPPDDDGNWTAADDHFRLIQWDGINDGNATQPYPPQFVNGTMAGVNLNHVIIRNHHPDLQTPTPYQQQELGLYTAGDGAAGIYFDDFGLQIDLPVTSPNAAPLQQ